MNCEDCKPQLTDFSRDQLPAEMHASVMAHLRECPYCSREVAALRQIAALLDAEELPSAQLRQGFQARLEQTRLEQTSIERVGLEQASLEQERPVPSGGHQQRKRLSGLFHLLWPSRPVWACAYSVLLLCCGLVSGQLLPADSLGLSISGSATAVTQSANGAISEERLIQLCSVQNPRNSEIL